MNTLKIVLALALASPSLAQNALNAPEAASNALRVGREAGRALPPLAGKAVETPRFTLDMSHTTRSFSGSTSRTCGIVGGKVTLETRVVSGGSSSSYKSQWDVEHANAQELEDWIRQAEGGTLETGRYIPSQRGWPTVTYGAQRADGAYVYLSYDGPFYWERNSSTTARVMLEAAIKTACRL